MVQHWKGLGEVCLYCFTPGRLASGRDPLEMVMAQIRGGADVIQLREKHASKRARLELGIKVREITRKAGVLFIVNDDLDLALILDADGLHLGQEDLPLEYVRPFLEDKLVGISTHSEDEIKGAVAQGPDYIAIGPIYPTETKEDPDPVVGVEMVKTAQRLSPVPFVAIGGITEARVPELVAAGCRRVAIISDILLSDDIEGKCRRIKQMLMQTG